MASTNKIKFGDNLGVTDEGAGVIRVDGAPTGAPTTADYLVGTTQAGLTGEIVVGATPGGELGGTWAAPTVDATHSGSSHAATQTAAEATAAAALTAHLSDATDAHDASAVSFSPTGTIAATDVQAAIAEVASEAGAGGAPTDATYVTVSAEAGLSAETLYTALKLDDFAAPDDNTDLNVSTTKHGLTPKLSNVSTEYLSGTGVYSTPAGAGGASSTDNLFLTRYVCKR